MELQAFIASKTILIPALQTVALLLLLRTITVLLRIYWLRPMKLRRLLDKQDVTGPPPHFVTGNRAYIAKIRKQLIKDVMDSVTHDIVPQILPEYFHSSKIYGKTFVQWMGVEPVLYVANLKIIKELAVSKYGTDRPIFIVKDRAPLFGNGLLMASGEKWVHQRRVVGPSFQTEKIKGMVSIMDKCTRQMLERWDELLESEGSSIEIDVSKHLTALTADIIAHTAFGSNYEEGKLVFTKLSELQALLYQSSRLVGLPGSRYLPTASNRRMWKLKGEVGRLLDQIVKQRQDSVKLGKSETYGRDLLGLLLAESKGGGEEGFSKQEVVDQCKTFFFAGHETVAQAVSWTMLLLALHPEWQERLRVEVKEVCKRGREGMLLLDAESLSKMKTVQLVLNESMRLYPPAPYLRRYASKDLNVGEGMVIPKGVNITVPIIAIHHDEDLWGEDVNEFKPQRFEDNDQGIRLNKYSFLPFGFGIRICVGQAFALMEAKLLVALIVSHYTFTLSPSYRHSPFPLLTIRPKYGLPLVIHKLPQTSLP